MSEKFLKDLSECGRSEGGILEDNVSNEKMVSSVLSANFNNAVMMVLALLAVTASADEANAQEPEVAYDPCGGFSGEEFIYRKLPPTRRYAFDDIGLFQQCAPGIVDDAFIADKLIPYLDLLDTSPPSWGFIPYSSYPVGPKTREALTLKMLTDNNLRRYIVRTWPFSCNDQDMTWSDYSWEVDGHPVITEEDVLDMAREYPEDVKSFNNAFTGYGIRNKEKCMRNELFIQKLRAVVQEALGGK